MSAWSYQPQPSGCTRTILCVAVQDIQDANGLSLVKECARAAVLGAFVADAASMGLDQCAFLLLGWLNTGFGRVLILPNGAVSTTWMTWRSCYKARVDRARLNSLSRPPAGSTDTPLAACRH